MDATSFRTPLRLRVDEGAVEIETLQEAVRFLDEWPASRRGPVYTCARKGCEAAMAGTMKVEDAWKALESFARITGILARRQVVADTGAPTRLPINAPLHR